MSLPSFFAPAARLGALGLAAVALGVFGSSSVTAKKATPANTKTTSSMSSLRPIDMKEETPGAEYAQRWYGFAGARKAEGSELFVRFSSLTGAPRVVYGDLGFAPEAATRADQALAFLEVNAELFGVDVRDIELARVFDGGTKPGHFYFDQKYRGLPVFYGEVAVHLDREGRVFGLTNTYTPVAPKSIEPAVDAETAFRVAADECGVVGGAEIIGEFLQPATLGIWPTADGSRLAWRVVVPIRQAGHFEVMVDAVTGEVLCEPHSLTCTATGTGKVFRLNPVASEGINNYTDSNDSGTAIPEAGYKSESLFNLNDSPNTNLIGAYARIHPSHTTPASSATLDFSALRRNNNGFSQENVYWTIDFGERMVQALGYVPGNSPIMAYPIKFYAHNSPTWGNDDNSSFSGNNIDGTGTGLLEFGTGGVDDAEDGEIVMHEWGHAMLWNQRPNISQNVSCEGMGEGWGDYLAATMAKRVPGGSSYWVYVGEWDATSYNPGNPPFLRKCNTSRFYPNTGGNCEVHNAGETWSHALFDYDGQVGPETALDVLLQANFLLDLSPTQVEGAAAVQAADNTLNGGSTLGLINNAFRERHTIAGTVVPVVHTIGVATAGPLFNLRNSITAGNADSSALFGPAGTTPLSGDWDGDGDDTIGTYDPATGIFYLKNTVAGGAADMAFQFGPGGLGWKPVVGDWDGDGDETIGLYDPSNGAWYLKNTNAGGAADLAFFYGPGGGTFTPVPGDFDGDGDATVGIYRASDGAWFLKNTNSAGNADLAFFYGPPNRTPLIADWDGTNTETVAVYDPATANWYFRNTNDAGPANFAINYGPIGATPLAGDWNRGMH